MDNLIRKLRGNLTQKELSEISGIAQDAISRYEAGRFPKPEILEKIAKAVGKKVEWVIKDIKESEK